MIGRFPEIAGFGATIGNFISANKYRAQFAANLKEVRIIDGDKTGFRNCNCTICIFEQRNGIILDGSLGYSGKSRVYLAG